MSANAQAFAAMLWHADPPYCVLLFPLSVLLRLLQAF